MDNNRIILNNHSKGSYGNVFTDSENNIYKITKISESGLLFFSNINEIIFYNRLVLIKLFLNSQNNTDNTKIYFNIEFDKKSFDSIIKEQLFIQSLSTSHYNYDNILKKYIFKDCEITSKYQIYLHKRTDKFLIVNTFQKYDYNLSKFIANFHLNVIENFDIIAKKLLKSLALLHHNGFVHGDLKTVNILISDVDNVSLIDFGAVKLTNFNRYYLSCTISSRCPEDLNYEYSKTPQYINSNFKSDIWSLGLIFTEMLLGYNPILKLYQKLENSGVKSKILERQILAYYKSIDNINVLEQTNCNSMKEHFNEKIYKQINVIEEMLKIDPAKRPSSIEEIYEKLFNEKMNYNFNIAFTYEYNKFNIDNKFYFLYNIRQKNYKKIINICDLFELLFICPLVIDILDRIFIKILDKLINNIIIFSTYEYEIIFCAVILIVCGLFNQIQVSYEELLNLFKIPYSITNIGNLNNNIMEILELLDYDIYRPFNIYYCDNLIEKTKCKCIYINTIDNVFYIHKPEEKNKLLLLLNKIIDEDIIGFTPNDYYTSLKN